MAKAGRTGGERFGQGYENGKKKASYLKTQTRVRMPSLQFLIPDGLPDSKFYQQVAAATLLDSWQRVPAVHARSASSRPGVAGGKEGDRGWLPSSATKLVGGWVSLPQLLRTDPALPLCFLCPVAARRQVKKILPLFGGRTFSPHRETTASIPSRLSGCTAWLQFGCLAFESLPGPGHTDLCTRPASASLLREARRRDRPCWCRHRLAAGARAEGCCSFPDRRVRTLCLIWHVIPAMAAEPRGAQRHSCQFLPMDLPTPNSWLPSPDEHL